MYLNYLKRKSAFNLFRWTRLIKNANHIPKESNVLLITAKHELAATQIYPFYLYAKTLREQYRINFSELNVETIFTQIKSNEKIKTNPYIKRIFFQPPFQASDEHLAKLLEITSEAYPNANIAFLDWFAPLDIRPSLIADSFIDIYIKKQIFSNFEEFSYTTCGDTNLNNYYAKRHSLPDPAMQYTPPKNFEKKLRIGSNFNLSPQMVDLFLGPVPTQENRIIDVHARIAINGVPWYKAMREEAKTAVEKLTNLKVISEGRVRRHKFFAELRRSKICFSPFGYGEVCWRDYEAFATGALLIKPDMSHLRVMPDTFIKNKTYISINWDLSDFEEKITEFIYDKYARQEITENAFMQMQTFITSGEAAIEIGKICAQ